MSQVTLHKIIWLINVIPNVGVEVLTSLHSSKISEKSGVQFVEVHADGSLNGLSRRSSAHQDDLSKKLFKPKSKSTKSTKSTKPRSDGSDEDKAWHQLRDRRETESEVPEDLPLSSSHEDPLFAAPNPMKSATGPQL